jgi:hypothetical protein
MATPRQLVENISKVLGVSVATVIVHDRNLAAANLRTRAGRGRAAAIVTAEDAANLLIALAASSSVKDSAATVLNYRRLKVSEPFLSSIARYDKLPIPHTFGHGLSTLIEAAAANEIESEGLINVCFFGPVPRALIEWEFDSASSSASYTKGGIERQPRIGDLKQMTTVSRDTIFCLGKVIGNDS